MLLFDTSQCHQPSIFQSLDVCILPGLAGSQHTTMELDKLSESWSSQPLLSHDSKASNPAYKNFICVWKVKELQRFLAHLGTGIIALHTWPQCFLKIRSFWLNAYINFISADACAQCNTFSVCFIHDLETNGQLQVQTLCLLLGFTNVAEFCHS